MTSIHLQIILSFRVIFDSHYEAVQLQRFLIELLIVVVLRLSNICYHLSHLRYLLLSKASHWTVSYHKWVNLLEHSHIVP